MNYSERFNDYVISADDLIKAGFSESAIKKAISRGQITAATRGFYLYSSLNTWQEQVKARLFNGFEPIEYAEIQQKEAENLEKTELQAIVQGAINSGYLSYLNEYMSLGPTRARDYAKSAASIDAIFKFMQENGISVRRFTWFEKTLMPILNEFELELPKAALNVQRYIIQKMYNEGLTAIDVIKPKRQGNTNAAKNKTDEELMSWITYLRSLGANFSNSHISRIVRLNCELAGKTIPSESWITHELAKSEMKFITSAGRFNSLSRNSNPYTGSIPLANALFAGDCWQGDGTRINMVAHKNNGKEQFLYIIAIRDVHSGDILGMHFDYVENRWGWLYALCDAVQNTGYLPYQLVIDRFPGHNTDEVTNCFEKLQRYGTKITFSSKATGKSQTERWFDTLQTVFMQNSRYYYGQGVQATRAFSHRTEEYLKQVKKEARENGWNIEKAITESVKTVEMFRHTPLSSYSRKHKAIEASPADLHVKSAKPNAINVKNWQLADIFWPTKLLTITKNQLVMHVNNEEALYLFDESHYGLLKQYSGAKVAVRYNENDLDKIYLFNTETGLPIIDLERFDRIQVFGPDAEYNRLAKAKQSNKMIDQQRRAELIVARERAEKSLQTPVFMGDEYDETAVLMGRTTPKHLKEANESRMLTGMADDDIEFNAREMY